LSIFIIKGVVKEKYFSNLANDYIWYIFSNNFSVIYFLFNLYYLKEILLSVIKKEPRRVCLFLLINNCTMRRLAYGKAGYKGESRFHHRLKLNK